MFSVSTPLVGVCLTTISMILVIENLSGYSTLCDALLAADALLFLFAAFCSFISFRLRFRWRWRIFLLAAEIALLSGLSSLSSSAPSWPGRSCKPNERNFEPRALTLRESRLSL
jgi:hypothetical protein